MQLYIEISKKLRIWQKGVWHLHIARTWFQGSVLYFSGEIDSVITLPPTVCHVLTENMVIVMETRSDCVSDVKSCKAKTCMGKINWNQQQNEYNMDEWLMLGNAICWLTRTSHNAIQYGLWLTMWAVLVSYWQHWRKGLLLWSTTKVSLN